MIITIDGPAGTGKTTIAKSVAFRLGFDYFDTGAMYRAVAYGLSKLSIDPKDEKALCAFLDQFDFQVMEEGSSRRYIVLNEDVTAVIRTPEIASLASQIAQVPIIRAKLVQLQRAYAQGRNTVFEGRDMGTVVFPKAECKIFLTARPEVRAQRRHLELSDDMSKEDVLAALKKRDEVDVNREISPLRQAQDAHLIDTSDLSVDEVVQVVLRMIG